MSDPGETLLASRIGPSPSEAAAILKQRSEALMKRADASPAGSAQRAELAAEARALRTRVTTPAWQSSDERARLLARPNE
ncbi:hypothetical protein FB562_1886 [Homoserinimonas aerilata]|uniref:Uncharacterized protein n=1 Tax=Homoserinimonas aerilata TaxID=1162970 RepID=A0A542YL13_9MICO|nr:hypothetical protein [Homoserinimonas aerilata]TQL48780.1 hypothetical protein FB562_1886 [Homoserinimonas aerilata]